MYVPYDGSSPAQSVEDLLKLNDEDFVRCAYISLLGRKVDSDGLETYVGHVRAGADRLTLIHAIATSDEGAKRDHALLLGLQEALQHVERDRASRDRPSYVSRLLAGPIARALRPLFARMDVCDYRLSKLEYLLQGDLNGVTLLTKSSAARSPEEGLTPRARSIYAQLQQGSKEASGKAV
jgi:Domain of unknown function (DUF4214)